MGLFKFPFFDYKKVQFGAGRYAGEFDAWQPIKSLAAKETPGFMSWAGGALQAIPAKVPAPVNQPMQHFFEEIAKRTWKHAKVSALQKTMFEQKHFLAQTRTAYPPPATPPPESIGAAFPPWAKGPAGSRPAFVSPSGNPGSKGASEIPDGDPKMQYLQGVAKDWHLAKDLERINAYTFRGDSREPHQIMKMGGFTPNSSRNDDAYLKNTIYPLFIGYMRRRFGIPVTDLVDQETFMDAVKSVIPSPIHRAWWTEYVIWRALEDSEKLHVGRMVAYEGLKGYTSTTRAVSVAKAFSVGNASPGVKVGWVYVTLIEGGIVVPDSGKHVWTQLFGEQEIAFPGTVPWSKIYGFRQVTREIGNKFTPDQPLFLRKGFREQDAEAFKVCYELLSGKPQ